MNLQPSGFINFTEPALANAFAAAFQGSQPSMWIVTHLCVLMPLPYSRRLGSGKKMRRFNSHKTVVAPALDRESSSWTGLIFTVVTPLFP